MDSNILVIGNLLAIPVGLVFCLQGYRIFTFSLHVVGFGLGALLVGGITFLLSDNNLLATIIAGIVGGVISWGIVYSFYRSGMFLLGFALTAIVFVALLGVDDAVAFDASSLESARDTFIEMLPVLGVGFIISFISGVLFAVFDKPVVKLLTAFNGAAVVVISLWFLLIGQRALPQSPVEIFSFTTLVFVGIWILLAALGGVTQFGLLPGLSWLRDDNDAKTLRQAMLYRNQMQQRHYAWLQQQSQGQPTRPPAQYLPQQGQPPPRQQRPPQPRQNRPRK